MLQLDSILVPFSTRLFLKMGLIIFYEIKQLEHVDNEWVDLWPLSWLEGVALKEEGKLQVG